MTKSTGTKNLGAISKQLYDLLDGLESDERAKVVNSVLQLYGDATPVSSGGASGAASTTPPGDTGTSQQGASATEQHFYAEKSPKNKGEMLAVAARYREQHGGGDIHQLNDFAAFFKEARQNFDRSNFLRDMKNATHQAGLFTKGMPKGQYQLSYFGQQYVDALPSREGLTKLKRPKLRGTTKRNQGKKAATK